MPHFAGQSTATSVLHCAAVAGTCIAMQEGRAYMSCCSAKLAENSANVIADFMKITVGIRILLLRFAQDMHPLLLY